ncbi:MAG: mannose-1-phosphate guanylyltransferase/mannose-6-phosphate isomerase [Woeseia sp.]|nr:mannose-1-phosphate guanylyltransferase/mannose-6-phosphate isomerase [Woeseia sp.]
MPNIQPVILSGGSGSRLWPASRSMYPKQLLPLVNEKTLLQNTVSRLDGLSGLNNSPIVICNETHRFLVAEQMQDIGVGASILLEPEGRNTCPAIALAALFSMQELPDDESDRVLLVLPADHVISDVEKFHEAISLAGESAEAGSLVTFGVVPQDANTGYGYIEVLADSDVVGSIKSFVEKPDKAAAKRYIASGTYFWNSGMFMFRASRYIEEVEHHAPEILSACRKAIINATSDIDFFRPAKKEFLSCPSNSIDYAIMEKTAHAVMVALDAGWNDVGSWQAIHSVRDKDEQGNTIDGDVVTEDCQNSFISSESRLVTAVGVDNLAIIETKDAVLVADQSSSQNVKALVDRLKTAGREETSLHRQVFRPWGSYDSLENADGFQVKRLIVNPGAVLSLQMHHHRAEHWVVVRGTARITLNDEEFDRTVNESTYIPIGATHRIANQTDTPVHIIEVQCGDYLGEDDIVRFEDNYGREGTNT